MLSQKIISRILATCIACFFLSYSSLLSAGSSKPFLASHSNELETKLSLNDLFEDESCKESEGGKGFVCHIEKSGSFRFSAYTDENHKINQVTKVYTSIDQEYLIKALRTDLNRMNLKIEDFSLSKSGFRYNQIGEEYVTVDFAEQISRVELTDLLPGNELPKQFRMLVSLQKEARDSLKKENDFDEDKARASLNGLALGDTIDIGQINGANCTDLIVIKTLKCILNSEDANYNFTLVDGELTEYIIRFNGKLADGIFESIAEQFGGLDTFNISDDDKEVFYKVVESGDLVEFHNNSYYDGISLFSGAVPDTESLINTHVDKDYLMKKIQAMMAAGK